MANNSEMEIIDKSVLDIVSQYVDNGLRDYQAHNKTEIYEKWKSTNSVLLQMPTGTGKTRLFVSLINDFKRYSEEHKDRANILIITHRKELVEQITKELSNPDYGINCSLITPEERYSHWSPKPVCVASIQTLSRRMYKWKNYHFDILIIDEAHHSRGKTYRQALKFFKDAKILGVTATPYRLNEVGLALEFDELIVSPPVKDFIEAGWLSNYDYYSIDEHNKLYDGLENVPLDSYGDYSVTGLWNFCKKDRIRAEIVGSYLKYARGKKGIVYTINKAHNFQLCSEFRRCGIRAYGIDSDTNADVRKDIVEKFRRGEIDVLCNVNIFTEGFDCPDVEFIQLARPTKSMGLYLQQVGRGLRVAPGKEKVIFLDCVGLHNRFGFPASKRMWGKHFVGQSATDFGREYAEKVDSALPFEMGNRNPDLSEGCDKITLLESTGINEIIEESKHEYLTGFEENLKPIIENIFMINRQLYDSCIEGFEEEHMSYKSEYKEDLINPCPFYLMKAETDDLDFMNEKIKKEFKPVLVDGEIDYEEYQDWNDFALTRMKQIYSCFKKKLSNAQSNNLSLLDEYTVGQLRVFFEKYYGSDHNMTLKLENFCTSLNSDAKWKDVKGSWLLRRYPVKKKDIYGYRIEYKD